MSSKVKLDPWDVFLSNQGNDRQDVLIDSISTPLLLGRTNYSQKRDQFLKAINFSAKKNLGNLQHQTYELWLFLIIVLALLQEIPMQLFTANSRGIWHQKVLTQVEHQLIQQLSVLFWKGRSICKSCQEKQSHKGKSEHGDRRSSSKILTCIYFTFHLYICTFAVLFPWEQSIWDVQMQNQVRHLQYLAISVKYEAALMHGSHSYLNKTI